MDKSWNTFYDVVIGLFGWTELPHDINANIFDKRAVTMSAMHSTSPGNAVSWCFFSCSLDHLVTTKTIQRVRVL